MASPYAHVCHVVTAVTRQGLGPQGRALTLDLTLHFHERVPVTWKHREVGLRLRLEGRRRLASQKVRKSILAKRTAWRGPVDRRGDRALYGCWVRIGRGAG